jgi:hypothetical protein
MVNLLWLFAVTMSEIGLGGLLGWLWKSAGRF